MPEPSLEERIVRSFTSEDKVIVISIVITLLLSPILAALWYLDDPILVPPPIIAIFLGISVSALLYRFLGGVHNATLTVGALKVTGTAAVLIFIAMWSNDELRQYVPGMQEEDRPFDISQHVIPSKENWYAVDKQTGSAIELDFPVYKQKHSPPLVDEINKLRKNRSLDLKNVDNEIVVHSNNGSAQIVGNIEKNEINKIGFYNDFDVEFTPNRVVSFTPSMREDLGETLPFEVETNGFSENYTKFSFISKQTDEVIFKGSIYLRGARVVKIENSFYLISIVQVNHNKEDDPYAKIYVAEIKVRLK